MNKRQSDQINMLIAVENHFDNSPTIWGSNVPISELKTALSAKINQVMEAGTKQRHTSKGATMDKKLLRKDLVAKALSVSTAVSAYISLNSEHRELYKTVFITQSNLVLFREAELLLYIEGLHEAALLLLENLGPFGVTESTLTDLMGARAAFYDIMKTPATIASNRAEVTKSLADLLRQGIALLDNTMDGLVKGLRTSEPDFVNVYFMDRKIQRTGTHTRSLEITTVNAMDKSPLAGVQIEVVGKKIKRISGEKGQNRVKNLKEGYYTLSVSHPDFVSQLIPFAIVNHETTKLVVELEEEVSGKVPKFLSF